MKAIIIEEKDCKALLGRLKLESFNNYGDRVSEIYGISEEVRAAYISEVHRRFHYVVTTWLQEQGSDGRE